VAVGASGGSVAAPSRPPALPASIVGAKHTHAAKVPAEVHVWAPCWPLVQAHGTLAPLMQPTGAMLVAGVVWPAAPPIEVWPPLPPVPPTAAKPPPPLPPAAAGASGGLVVMPPFPPAVVGASGGLVVTPPFPPAAVGASGGLAVLPPLPGAPASGSTGCSTAPSGKARSWLASKVHPAASAAIRQTPGDERAFMVSTSRLR
jgi:hypothetical protein